MLSAVHGLGDPERKNPRLPQESEWVHALKMPVIADPPLGQGAADVNSLEPSRTAYRRLFTHLTPTSRSSRCMRSVK